MLTTTTECVYKRDEALRMPLSEALWSREGTTYLQPEIQPLDKAAGRRHRDQLDFETTLPHLDRARRDWLGRALAWTLPDHLWTERL